MRRRSPAGSPARSASAARWARLGAGLPEGVGPKARMLDRAAAAGLAVPAGVVLLDGSVDADGGVDAPGWDGDLAGRVAVRSAFAVEDDASVSQAGRFDSVLDVPVHDPTAVRAAFRRVIASADGPADPAGLHAPDGGRADVGRRDVLVMAMVPAVAAGVAVTETGYGVDLVEWLPGLADRLVGGTEQGRRLRLEALRVGEHLDARERAVAPAFAERLAVLLAQIRATLGERDWDVEWADDGRVCWLVQVRPLSRPIARVPTLTVGNHKEILPHVPSAFMTGLIVEAGDDLLGWYRRHDPSLATGRPFVVELRGRPLLNADLLRDVLARWGIPTRLLVETMGAGAGLGPHSPLRLRRLLSSGRVLVRLAVTTLGAVGRARRVAARLRTRPPADAGDLSTAVDRAHDVYVDLVTAMLGLANRTSPPVGVLSRAGVLGELSARRRGAGGASVATRVLEAAEPLRRRAAESSRVRDAMLAGRVPDDAELERDLEGLLDAYGHRGVYESDLARPRFAEDPAPLLVAAASRRQPDVPGGEPLSLRARALLPLWWAARRAMLAREDLRHDAMRAFARVRADLLRLAADAARRGRLSTAADVWDLTPDEVRALDGHAVVTPDDLAQRRRRRAAYADDVLPDTVPADADADDLRAPGDRRHEAASRLRGRSLTRGRVTGVVWRLDEPATAQPEVVATADRVVLVARSVDAGWLPVIARVDAVVVETGGELSHGSIMIRELGVPAVTGVAGASALADGDLVAVDAAAGRVDRVEEG